MANSRKFVLVAFHTKGEAEAALRSALDHFSRSGSDVGHLSHCDDNIVFLQVTNSRTIPAMKEFLLKQEGALPDGCLVKSNEA